MQPDAGFGWLQLANPARLGYAFDSTLLYATGGVAFGSAKDTLSVTPSSGTPVSTVSSSASDTGFVVGGGVEHFITPAWSLKAEYQYIDLGSDKLSTTAGAGANAVSASLDGEHTYNTVRFGLNYHILLGFEPLK